MARFNEILTGRYNRFLQKLLQMKGGPPSAQLASEIMAQITLFHGNETMYLQGWDLFAGSFDVAAVAGVVSFVRLRNPINSGVIGVVTKAFITSTLQTKAIGNVGAVATDGTIQTAVSLDARSSGRQSTLQFSQGTGGVQFGQSIGTWFLPAGPTAIVEDLGVIDQPIPLLPGQAFQLISNVINTELMGGIWWMERALEESELK